MTQKLQSLHLIGPVSIDIISFQVFEELLHSAKTRCKENEYQVIDIDLGGNWGFMQQIIFNHLNSKQKPYDKSYAAINLIHDTCFTRLTFSEFLAFCKHQVITHFIFCMVVIFLFFAF